MAKADKDLLDSAFEFYLANQLDLVDQFNGRFIVIWNNEVVGSYDDEITAVRESKAKYPKGSFLVQHVTPGENEYTQVFHSRVAFN